MKKAGIITLYYKNNNYGGIAQAYALEKYINNIGIDAELVSYEMNKKQVKTRKDEIAENGFFNYCIVRSEGAIKKIRKKILNKIINKKYKDSINPLIDIRNKAFEKSREMCKHSEVYNDSTIKLCENKYDYFITGSDQVWKPGVVSEAFVWGFLPDDKIRISYASSITSTSLDENYEKFMKKYLSKYKWISVREEEGKKYLKNVLEKNVDRVLDPTLLINKNEWNRIVTKKKFNEKYIFAYMLGDSQNQRNIIKKFAKKNKLKIVTMPHLEGKLRYCDINFGDEKLYNIDLPEFLSLIKYSEYVFTDSFHAVIFSNIFEKKYAVFEREVSLKRENMNSRLDTLLDMLEQKNRKIRTVKDFSRIEEKIDFMVSEKKLKIEREKSESLLKKALDIK